MMLVTTTTTMMMIMMMVMMMIKTDPEPIIIMTGTIDAVLYCQDDSAKSGLCLTSFTNSLVTFCTISG